MKLTRAVGERRAIIVNVTHKSTTAIAYNLGPLSLNSPVIKSLKERSDLVLLLEPELGGVDRREGERAFVPCLEVEIRRVETSGA